MSETRQFIVFMLMAVTAYCSFMAMVKADIDRKCAPAIWEDRHSMTTIERMARAMAENDSGPEGSALFDIHWGEFGEGYKSSALAALKALREPSEGMCRAGESCEGSSGPGPWLDGGYEPENVEQIFRAMIDAAISEAEGRE